MKRDALNNMMLVGNNTLKRRPQALNLGLVSLSTRMG
jgi:hypothetical protein